MKRFKLSFHIPEQEFDKLNFTCESIDLQLTNDITDWFVDACCEMKPVAFLECERCGYACPIEDGGRPCIEHDCQEHQEGDLAGQRVDDLIDRLKAELRSAK